MAVNRNAARRLCVALTTWATLMVPSAHAAEAADDALAPRLNPRVVARTAAAWLESATTALRASGDRVHAEWSGRDALPEWVHLRSADPGADPGADVAPAGGEPYLIVQEDRPDGTDMVTVRYPLAERGGVRAYAGAGLNRAQYFDAGDDLTPTILARRERHSTLGAAAELGAELRVNERVQLAADVRWADFATQADVLRADYGPVGAAPVMLGMTLGYRFR
jgi:hypothetical protein